MAEDEVVCSTVLLDSQLGINEGEGDNTTKIIDSLPVIVLTEDHNANSVEDTSGIHALGYMAPGSTFPISPRREGHVTLPKRYTNKLREHGQGKDRENRENRDSQNTDNINESISIDGDSHTTGITLELMIADVHTSIQSGRDKIPDELEVAEKVSSRWSDRISDMESALKWIRQEVMQIKQEDRFLMRRLLDLRARLRQLQGLPAHFSLSTNLAYLGSCSSDLDVATWSSFMSLDEDALCRDPVTDSPMTWKEVLLSFQDNNTEGVGLYGSPLCRSATARESSRPPKRIRRKKSLPMANELEEDHFFDDDDDC